MCSKRVHSITHLVCVGWSTQSQSIHHHVSCMCSWSTYTDTLQHDWCAALSGRGDLTVVIMMRFLVPHICCLSVPESYNCTKLVGTCFQVVVVVVVVHAFKGHAFWHDCYGWVFVCLSMK